MNELKIYHNITDDNLRKLAQSIFGNFEYVDYEKFYELEDDFIVIQYDKDKNDIEAILSKNNVMILTNNSYIEYFFELSTNYRFQLHLYSQESNKLLIMNLKAFIDEAYKIFELKNQIEELEDKIFDLAFATTDVLEQKEKAELMVTKDGMTKLYNHSAFKDFLQKEFLSAVANCGIFSIAILDLDHFKNVNDRYGHIKGDEVIRAFANCIHSNVEANIDIAARYGGEEFAIIFKNQTCDEAINKIDNMRLCMNNTHFQHEDTCFKVTFSAGLTEFSKDLKDSNEMLKIADDALYQSKKNGRNRNTIKLKSF